MDICIFQWAAESLKDLHVTTPFMSMLLDQKVTQRELLDVLPCLHKNLYCYETIFIKFDGPAVNQLTKFWRTPFKKNVFHMG